MLPGFFDRLETALDPDDAEALVFARYTPDAYLRGSGDEEENARARGTVGLLRSGLLKRFESSAFAFRRTTEKMVGEHDVFLEALDEGHVATTAFMQELSGDDDDAFDTLLTTSTNLKDASLYDIDALRAAVVRDRDILSALAADAASITPDRDPKLTALAAELAGIAEQAVHEATDAGDEAQKRKVLVFSFFADSVRWVRDFLETEVHRRTELSAYAHRMGAVSGQDDLSEVSRHEAVQGFAPLSMEAPAGQDADRYDLLISTDVLAEGVNLQQCRHIVNFDMPWNPMRLVQRHGRIDRIGSPHNRVFLRTIFPVDRLDRLLNLEQRILAKIGRWQPRVLGWSLRSRDRRKVSRCSRKLGAKSRNCCRRILRSTNAVARLVLRRPVRSIDRRSARRWPATAKISSVFRGRRDPEWSRVRGAECSFVPWSVMKPTVRERTCVSWRPTTNGDLLQTMGLSSVSWEPACA